MTRLLVVGSGMVADRFVDELSGRGRLAHLDVTLVGEEEHGAYNRIMLSHVLAGDDPASIVYRSPAWAAEVGVCQITGRWVQRLDTVRREAAIGDGEVIGYDLAVLATGSTAIIPPISGARGDDGRPAPGVHVYRSMADCTRLRDAVIATSEVVVVGGGLLGLEAAAVLADGGARVTVVHPTPTLLDAQLDEVAGGMLRQAMVDRGIDVVVGLAHAVLRDPVGAIHGLCLDDGRIVGADQVVLTTGVRPRTEAAAASGITVDRGIVVDDGLATSAPDVYAIGDCAEHRGVCNGLVSSGWEQAAILAARLSGDDRATYTGAARATRLKVAGVEVAAMGVRDPEPDDDVVTVCERRRQVYRRLIVREGRVAGAILYGDADGAAAVIGLYDRQTPLPDQALDLFCSTDAFRVGSGGVGAVCTCNQVDEASVVTAIEAGARSVAAVGESTRAGTGCGTCRDRIRQLIDVGGRGQTVDA